MDDLSIRDSAMTALILGFFASSWFGWAQERPPAAWRTPLIVGSVLSLAIAVLGGVYAWRNWSGASALGDDGAMRRYLILLGIEFGVAGLGAIALAATGHSQWLAPWICLVVGVHFWPMASVLENPMLVPLGILLALVAIAGVLVARGSDIAPSAVTGLGAGVCLLAFAGYAAKVTI